MRVALQKIVLFSILASLLGCIPAQKQAKLEQLGIYNDGEEIARYSVEVARTEFSRRKGLMHRQSLAEDQGMLLYYKRARQTGIWMKNTHIPLDILFIASSGKIVKVHSAAKPLSLQTIDSGEPVRAVLELNAGQLQKHGIHVGNRISHQAFPAYPPR